MAWRAIEAMAGVAIVLATMLDVFLTVVVPGRASVGPRTTAVMRRLFLPLWIFAAHKASERRAHAILGTFPGVLLVSVFLLWLAMLLLGLSMAAHALRDSFSPPLAFAEALFQVGSAMMTLGLSAHQAGGWGRVVIVAAGVSGLLVVTVTLTYILQVQSALQRRDPLVLLLPSRAGIPPSALRLLLVSRELGIQSKLGQLFEQWERWAGDVLHAYSAWPILLYFRSERRDVNWLAALNAMLDAAVLVQFVDEAGGGEARLFYRAGIRVIDLLCETVALHTGAAPIGNSAEWAGQVDRLAAAGYALADRPERLATVERMRSRYESRLRALSDELDLPIADAIAPA